MIFVSKETSVKNVIESNVEALVEVSNAEYLMMCNGYFHMAVEEWLEKYDFKSCKFGYCYFSNYDYCGVKEHPACSSPMYKVRKSSHTEKCYHPKFAGPYEWPLSQTF